MTPPVWVKFMKIRLKDKPEKRGTYHSRRKSGLINIWWEGNRGISWVQESRLELDPAQIEHNQVLAQRAGNRIYTDSELLDWLNRFTQTGTVETHPAKGGRATSYEFASDDQNQQPLLVIDTSLRGALITAIKHFSK